MGRAFEFRKARKFKRWGQMAKTFTKIGKDIVIAVKAGGPDPTANSRLRAIIQNAKAVNMPKDNVERAIKRAVSKDQEDYKEIVYEGYALHGIAILVETTTDNINRTVANIRSSFTKCGGSLGTQGMLDFIFTRKSVFKIAAKPDIDLEELEFDLIDLGGDEVFLDEEDELNEEYEYGTILWAPVVTKKGVIVETAYSCSLEDIKAWINFLRECGGFKIW